MVLRTVAWVALSFGVGAGIAIGCQKADERAPGIDVKCEAGVKCGEPAPIGAGSGGSSALPDAQNDGPTADITGTIALITADDFTTATPFLDTATVEMETSGGTPVSGTYDGSSFALQGVLVAPDVWATVTPATPGEALQTLQPVDTSAGGPFQLLTVQRSVLELIYGMLNNPTTPAAGTAQVVLQFLNAETSAPIAGVRVTHTAEAIAYDVAGSYSDVATETGPAGIVILVNVPALTTPAKQKVMVQLPSTSGALEILMRSDAITLTDVLVAP